MTLSTLPNRKRFAGDAVTVLFPFPYKFMADADLVVILTSAAGLDSTLVLDTDYTVSGELTDATGAVTLVTAPAVGEVLTIYRDTAIEQDLELETQGPFPATEVELRFDKAAMWAQRLSERIDRAICLKESDNSTTLPMEIPLPALRAGKFLGFDASGTLIVGESIASGTIISSFAETLLDDQSATQMLNTLGFTPFAMTMRDDGSATEVLNTLGFSPFAMTYRGDTNASSTLAHLGLPKAVPTVQKFLSGTGTYTTPAGCRWIRVRMVGGGGGGAGGGTTGTDGTAGGNTTFGSTLVVANGGGGGIAANAANGPAGGSASLGAGVIGISVSGGSGGGSGLSGTAGVQFPGGHGGSSPFGGAGAGGVEGSVGGRDAAANSGSGGGGGGGAVTASGTGGAAGGYAEGIIGPPAATYAYAVGAAGAAGALSGGAGNGGAGSAGQIVVEEYYA